MTAPPLPVEERERLEALMQYRILDSPAEAGFDAVTAFIAAICDTPIAIVSFVDANRQWFKSQVGLTVHETARDVSFCAHAILEPSQIMVVPDATQDARFSGNALVTGDPNIRFYAGTPLLSADGHALGTLCVIDSKPRVMTPQQEETLRLAGRTVELLLEQRCTIAQLQQIELELRSEIVQRRHVEARLTHESSHDSLTQLPNRAQFMVRLTATLTDLQKGVGERFAVCFVDLCQLRREIPHFLR